MYPLKTLDTIKSSIWSEFYLDFYEIKFKESITVIQIPGKDNTIPSNVSVLIAIFC